VALSEVANQIGLRPSAVRYYEQIGILPPAQRVSGQRTITMTRERPNSPVQTTPDF
jgi:hypothetical protein